jgi:hypothetical protein
VLAVNRLISIVPLAALVVASFIGCNKANRQPPPDSSHSAVHLVEGEYLSSDYIDELRKTRSPLNAGSSYGMELVRVRRDGTKFVLEPIINFHEGDSGFAINQDGSVAPLPEPRVTDISNVTATVLDDHTIRFGYGSFKPATYVCVKDAAVYVSGVVLVGRYKDEQGLRYDFQADGWAVFPDRKFEYEIGLDHVLDGFDYFMDAAQDKKRLPWTVWAIKWNGDTLQIFRTTDEGGVDEIADSRPLLVLHPVR